ncbi:hypothetical protein Aau02nite_55660 [Amorphoplanes auranticolor]|uniref:Uncharacterized protein n=1 Tax=Actinoplanes auranticolor TaxID=47988 RepID=A0A919VY52_9ACTN|nr:hypothetical protein Aau02nite_55660 [Actinoplanes auranticolor]
MRSGTPRRDASAAAHRTAASLVEVPSVPTAIVDVVMAGLPSPALIVRAVGTGPAGREVPAGPGLSARPARATPGPRAR